MKAVFVDFSHNFYDKHWVYSLYAGLAKQGIPAEYINEKTFGTALKRLRVLVRSPNSLAFAWQCSRVMFATSSR